MAYTKIFAALIGCVCIGSTAVAQDTPTESPTGIERVVLETFLEPIADELGIEFLIDVRSPYQIYVGGTDVEDITYSKLLSILRNNQLIAVEIDGRMNILPEALARMSPVPLVQEDDADIADDQIVSRIIRMQNMDAPQAVPILRPLLPQYAHLAALVDQNALVIVDRYANVRRVTEILRELDN